MKTRTVVISIALVLFLVGGAFLFGLAAAVLSHASRGGGRSWFSSNAIGLVTVKGPIYESQDIIDELEDFRLDDSIKAVILRIDSPGGSVAASQEIYDTTKRLAEAKPVIASMGAVAASGGYYIALGASEIIANPGTITGSIGVRLDHVMLRELLDWAKIRYEILKSGKYKDIGSFDRPLTSEEKVLLQDMLDDIHTQFKEAVMASRKLDKAAVDNLADGRVFTGREALGLKLVDTLGGYIDAVEVAKERGGITGEPNIVEHHEFEYEWLREAFKGAIDIIADRIAIDADNRAMKLPLFESAIR